MRKKATAKPLTELEKIDIKRKIKEREWAEFKAKLEARSQNSSLSKAEIERIDKKFRDAELNALPDLETLDFASERETSALLRRLMHRPPTSPQSEVSYA